MGGGAPRACRLHTRAGKPSAPGVPKARGFRSDADAEAHLIAERDKRLAEGYVVIDEGAGLDTPFTADSKPRERRVPASTTLSRRSRAHRRVHFPHSHAQ